MAKEDKLNLEPLDLEPMEESLDLESLDLEPIEEKDAGEATREANIAKLAALSSGKVKEGVENIGAAALEKMVEPASVLTPEMREFIQQNPEQYMTSPGVEDLARDVAEQATDVRDTGRELAKRADESIVEGVGVKVSDIEENLAKKLDEIAATKAVKDIAEEAPKQSPIPKRFSLIDSLLEGKTLEADDLSEVKKFLKNSNQIDTLEGKTLLYRLEKLKDASKDSPIYKSIVDSIRSSSDFEDYNTFKKLSENSMNLQESAAENLGLKLTKDSSGQNLYRHSKKTIDELVNTGLASITEEGAEKVESKLVNGIIKDFEEFSKIEKKSLLNNLINTSASPELVEVVEKLPDNFTIKELKAMAGDGAISQIDEYTKPLVQSAVSDNLKAAAIQEYAKRGKTSMSYAKYAFLRNLANKLSNVPMLGPAVDAARAFGSSIDEKLALRKGLKKLAKSTALKSGTKAGLKAGSKAIPILGQLAAAGMTYSESKEAGDLPEETLKKTGTELVNITPIPTEIIYGTAKDYKDFLRHSNEAYEVREAEEKAKEKYEQSKAKQDLKKFVKDEDSNKQSGVDQITNKNEIYKRYAKLKGIELPEQYYEKMEGDDLDKVQANFSVQPQLRKLSEDKAREYLKKKKKF